MTTTTHRPPRADIPEAAALRALDMARMGNTTEVISAATGIPRQTVAGIVSGKFRRDLAPNVPRLNAAGEWAPLVPTAREEEIVRACCDSDLDATQAADRLGMSASYCRAISRGDYLAWVLPHIERRPPDLATRSCRTCRFFTGRDEQPCDLRLPGADGVAAARSCGTYLP